jgi:hypothetical protein
VGSGDAYGGHVVVRRLEGREREEGEEREAYTLM